MGRIRAICFDLDDTLWPSRPVLEAAEQRFYQQLQRLAPELTAQHSPDALRDHRLQLLQQQPELRHHISRWRCLSLEILLRECGYGERSHDIVHEAFHHFIEARQQVELYAHAKTVLATLSREYQLVSLTNGNAELQRQPCSRYFSACLKAEDIGISKPHEAAFQAAVAATGCAVEEVVHIGDHPRDDIEGATNAGLRAVQALMPGLKHPRHDGANAHFSDWRQLPGVLSRLTDKA